MGLCVIVLMCIDIPFEFKRIFNGFNKSDCESV